MEYNEFQNLIANRFKTKIGIELDDKKCHKFYDYMNLLIEKNKVMNLTAIVEPEEIIERHFVDSCIFNRFYQVDENTEIVDIGTGAGFPGVPLAIINETAKFVLTDTLGKRIGFLQEVIDKLGINNIELVKARAEDFGKDKKYREKFDFVVSRGVAKISVLSEYDLPCANIGGKMIAWKMDDCDTELNEGTNALKMLGGMFHVKHSYRLIESESSRCLLEIKKIKSTPTKYPRQAGTPSKNPL